MGPRIRVAYRACQTLQRIGQCRHYSSASSASPTEILHFDKLASTWWAPHGPSRLLHQMNPSRHDFIRSCLSFNPSIEQPKKLRYLDIGCGGGIFAESAARLANTESVLAIDPSSEVIKVAKRHARQDPCLQQPARLVYENRSIEDLKPPQSVADQFDVLTLFEVIEHVDYPARFLDTCLPFVKPGGWIVLSTIARSWVSWLTTKVVAEDVVGLVPKGTHQWDKYINEEELRGYFRAKAGWGGDGAFRCQGIAYVPWLSWQPVSGGEKVGNYFFGIRRDPP